jgi:hypothetical protein
VWRVLVVLAVPGEQEGEFVNLLDNRFSLAPAFKRERRGIPRVAEHSSRRASPMTFRSRSVSLRLKGAGLTIGETLVPDLF